MKNIHKMLLGVSLLFVAAYSQVDTTKQHYWMMTYFINGQDPVGARLAFSSDTMGLKWQYYNNQASILTPIMVTGANDSKMRDPMMEYDSVDNYFNMVWTVSWTGTTIGWDTTTNLKNWGPQQGLAGGRYHEVILLLGAGDFLGRYQGPDDDNLVLLFEQHCAVKYLLHVHSRNKVREFFHAVDSF